MRTKTKTARANRSGTQEPSTKQTESKQTKGLDLGGVKPLWDEHQVAKYLKCSVQHVRKLRYAGTGPAWVQVGPVRYRPFDVRTWVKNLRCTNSIQSDALKKAQTDLANLAQIKNTTLNRK